jgi:hypothetical protein
MWRSGERLAHFKRELDSKKTELEDQEDREDREEKLRDVMMVNIGALQAAEVGGSGARARRCLLGYVGMVFGTLNEETILLLCPASVQEQQPLAHATLRNTRTVALGGLRQYRRWASGHQVAHAADGLLGAPSPPALVQGLDPLWVPPAAAAGEALFPFDVAPPEF